MTFWRAQDEERYDVETQESAVRTLEIICNICSYCPYSVLVTQILQTESVTAKLLHYTLSERYAVLSFLD